MVFFPHDHKNIEIDPDPVQRFAYKLRSRARPVPDRLEVPTFSKNYQISRKSR